mgnify:CR=1 FL=1
MSVLLIIGKGATFLVLLAAILFAFDLACCFMFNDPSTPKWARIAGGVVTFITLSAVIGLWMQ